MLPGYLEEGRGACLLEAATGFFCGAGGGRGGAGRWWCEGRVLGDVQRCIVCINRVYE